MTKEKHTLFFFPVLFTLPTYLSDFCRRNIGHNIIATGMPTVIPTLTGFYSYGTALPGQSL
jgi:uncharacterized membrane protein